MGGAPITGDGMMKYLLIADFFRHRLVGLEKAFAAATGRPRVTTRIPVERMVTCAHCGVHLPESDALPMASSIFATGASPGSATH
jgi:hypothetical protein